MNITYFRVLVSAVICWAWVGHSIAAEKSDLLYENDFEKADVEKVPENFLVLDGQFTVKQEGTNRVLDLPGAPLETFGALFGPTEGSNTVALASFLGTGKGRRYPTFAIGLNGVGGYRLQNSPGKKQLELYKGDAVVASVPFEWKSGEWTKMRLQVRVAGGDQWKIEGKAWSKGAEEPKEWLITFDDPKPAQPGRASVWGSPYSGTAIQFDDLHVHRLSLK